MNLVQMEVERETYGDKAKQNPIRWVAQCVESSSMGEEDI